MTIKTPKILIIDDIKDNISIIQALIKKNFDAAIVLTASSGSLGIELAKSTNPDLILLDILMPLMDGFEVCEKLKEIPKLKDVPIVFVTAQKEEVELKIKALDVGAEWFLTKPIDQPSLVAMINAMLKVREGEIEKTNRNVLLETKVKERTKLLNDELKAKSIIEDDLRSSEERYAALVEHLDSGVVVHGPDTAILACNEKAAELLGLTVEEVTGKNAYDPFWYFVDINSERLDFLSYPANLISTTHLSLRNYVIGIVTKKHPDTVWVSVNGFPRFDSENNINEIVISFHDITDVVEKENRLIYAANNDYLTGLYNRRYFENKLHEFSDGRFEKLSIAIADINGLKLINDAFGHVYGDKLLQETAKVIKESVAKEDIIARIGGDEFAILMPNCSATEVDRKISNIHEASGKVKIQSIELSISIGHATTHNGDLDLFELSRTAEDRMYRQKLIEIPSMRSNAIETILSTLYEKDQYSEMHSRSVSAIAEKLAIAHGLDIQAARDIKTAGLLHDIGKIIIPSIILTKDGPLTGEERKTIQTHSEIGFRILNSSSQLRKISNYVLNHHERWDGTGYPRNIKGEMIPIESRIIAIADAFDAMTVGRIYRKPLSFEEATNEIEVHSGTQFDPDLVATFVSNLDKFIELKESIS